MLKRKVKLFNVDKIYVIILTQSENKNDKSIDCFQTVASVVSICIYINNYMLPIKT